MQNHPQTSQNFFWPCLIITVFSAVCITIATHAQGDELRTVTLQLPHQHQFRFAGYYAAQSKGYYEENGIKTIFKNDDPSTNTIDIVTQGHAQYGIAGGELVYHRLQGKPVVALASVFQHSSSIFLTKRDSGISSPQDMIGRTILLQEGYASTEYLAMLRSENVPLNRVHFVNGHFNPLDLQHGKIDIISGKITSEPFLLKQLNTAYTLIKPNTYGIDFYGDTLFTSEQEAQAHPEHVQAFKEASLKGWTYAMQHPFEIINLIITTYQSPQSHDYLTFEARMLRDLIKPDNIEIGHMNPGRWNHIATTYAQLGMVPHDYSLDGFLFTNKKEYNFNSVSQILLIALVVIVFSCILFFYHVNRKLRRLISLQNHQLNTSNKKFQQLTNNLTHIAVQGYNDQREVFFWNKASELLYGYSEKEANGKKLEDLIIPEAMKGHFVEAVSRWVNLDIPINSAKRILQHKNGQPLYVQSSHVMFEEQPANREMYCIDLDLTSLQQAEKEKKKSIEKYRLLFETMFDGFALHEMIFDASGNGVDYRYLAVNPAFEKITGYTANKVVGRKVSEIFPHLQNNWIEKYEKVVTTGVPTKFIDHTIELDKYFEVAAFRPQDGHFACFFKNITEKKKAEDKIQYQASLLDHVRNCVYVTSNNGIIRYWNKYATKIYQYRAEEVAGRSLVELIIPQQSITALQKSVLLRKKHGKWEGEILHRRKNGSLFSAYVAETVLKDKSGDVTAILGVSIDMTERNDLLKQLQQSQKMESIGTLAGGIAHDFNNILGAIIGYTEMAEDEIPDWTPGKENIPEILQASNRAKDLVKQILAFSRNSEQQQMPMDISTVLQEVLTLIKASTPASIKIIKHIDSTCGNILGNPTQMHQICINLCTNATQAMEKHGGTLTVRVESKVIHANGKVSPKDLTPGRYVALSIHDNGCGIAAKNIDHIFDPYFTTKEVGNGSGLGLSVVHGLTRDHNGTIVVDSELGRGTTFTIYFPEISRKVITSPDRDTPLQRGNERILVVDDEKSIVLITTRSLKKLGYRVTGITESVEALELFWEDPSQFDLVITDQTMPELSGDELTLALHDIRPDLPVILCTGYNYLMDKEMTVATGIHTCLTKPVNKTDLATAVREALDSVSNPIFS